jgi:23S rRNA-/tRNA-specific pseudouridylate synthase
MARHQGITRQMLHARVLSFTHPDTQKRLHIEAPYPQDFQNMMPI